MAKQADALKRKGLRDENTAATASAADEQAFALEQAFADAGSIFLPHAEVQASDSDVLIALDANTLLMLTHC
jgi:hypothetical protein